MTDKEQALIEFEKLLDEFAYEIECGNERHADAYQAILFALVIIEQEVRRMKTYDELLFEYEQNGYRDECQPETLDDLIDQMEKCKRRDMTEQSRGGYGNIAAMGEYDYGVCHVPIRWVLSIVKEYSRLLKQDI